METKDAKSFLAKIQKEADFRISLYEYENKEELFSYLNECGYTFSAQDFENTLNNMLSKCQYQELGEQLEAIRIWWSLLTM